MAFAAFDLYVNMMKSLPNGSNNAFCFECLKNVRTGTKHQRQAQPTHSPYSASAIEK